MSGRAGDQASSEKPERPDRERIAQPIDEPAGRKAGEGGRKTGETGVKEKEKYKKAGRCKLYI